jgi:predicted O-linked N-acetylglucosamine transferase (SPINDLY family)
MAEQDIAAVPPFERNGHLTFGSFNSAIKVTPEACRRWAQAMLRVPGSRLLVGDINSGRKRAAILREIEGQGVAGDRVEFMPRVALARYLDLYNAVDITFDTFPYGGGTTTFDSLWMGVPVVAAVGDTPVSRSAASILAALGLDDWIAASIERFVDVAVARATDLDALRALRRDLRPRLQASPLTDLPRFTRDLESAYRRMWLDKTG